MKTEDQIMALARLGGVRLSEWIPENVPSFIKYNNYTQSRDVIVPLRLKVCSTKDLKVRWLNAAREIVGRRCEKNKSGAIMASDFDIASITAAEDCEAVLKATGKWTG